jgi:predicted ATPase
MGQELLLKDLSDDLFEINFKSKFSKSITNIADAGFGTSQVLPLITQAIAAAPDSLTLAEQPEIHLNPRLQCVLADLFVEMAAAKRRVIVETHSEHLLLRLRRLVAMGKISHEDVALYFIERDREQSTIRHVPIQKNGHIKPADWPAGFFGETLRESLALATTQGSK